MTMIVSALTLVLVSLTSVNINNAQNLYHKTSL